MAYTCATRVPYLKQDEHSADHTPRGDRMPASSGATLACAPGQVQGCTCVVHVVACTRRSGP